MYDPVRIASPAQAGCASVGYQERGHLAKDVAVSDMLDDVMETSANLHHCQMANLLPMSSSDAKDGAESICRPLRQLLLKGARFCPKQNTPSRQQLHHHRRTEIAAMLNQTNGHDFEKAMHCSLLVPSDALQGAEVY